MHQFLIVHDNTYELTRATELDQAVQMLLAEARLSESAAFVIEARWHFVQGQLTLKELATRSGCLASKQEDIVLLIPTLHPLQPECTARWEHFATVIAGTTEAPVRHHRSATFFLTEGRLAGCHRQSWRDESAHQIPPIQEEEIRAFIVTIPPWLRRHTC